MPPRTRSKKGKATAAKHKPKRKNSSSTEEGDNEVEAELLVPDESKSASTRKSTQSLTSPRKKNPHRSNQRGVFEEPEQEDLLEFVESNLGGGRDALLNRARGIPRLLETIAEQGRTDLVGVAASKQRKAAYDKINFWLKKISAAEYAQLLSHHKVLPNGYREPEDSFEIPSKKQSSAKKPLPFINTSGYGAYRDNDTSILTSEDESTAPSTQPSKMSKKTDEQKQRSPRYEKVGNLLIRKCTWSVWLWEPCLCILTSPLSWQTTAYLSHLSEHIDVDVDCLELVPPPYKIYKTGELEPTESDGLGTEYYGYRAEISCDPRELQSHDVLKNSSGQVIRPRIEAFKFASWIRKGVIVVKVPLLSWADRGNDDHILRKKYENQNWFKSYMAGRDDLRKKVIADYGEKNYQSAHKHVHFHLYSSQNPNRLFDLNTNDIKLNQGKEDDHMKLHYHSYLIEGDEYEYERTTIDQDTSMEIVETVEYREVTDNIRLSFYVADLAIRAKRSGEESFNIDSAVDELTKAMEEDAQIGGKRRKKKQGI